MRLFGGAPALNAIAYRPELDGLRAVAVTAVVAYHAKLGPAPGGFVGVDVFFVISGYLISSLIMADVKARRFSMLAFYERRIRRLLPALLAVIAACLAAGYWRMTPDDFVLLGRTALAALGFHSNFWLAGRAGYFMPQSEMLPLLHTWSLGVEAQFYLIAPLLFLFGARAGRRAIGIIFWPLLAVAFFASVAGASTDSERAFYLFQTRAFELMIGVGLGLSLVPEITSSRAREAVSLLGLLMIGAAVVFYTPDMEFPGIAVLLPCIGAALFLHCARSGEALTGTGRLLATAPFVAIGIVSYSLYLWHWPMLAFAEYEWPGQLAWTSRLAICAAALIMAFASYRWIEQPARRSQFFLTRTRVFAGGVGTALVLAALVLAALAQAIVVFRGLPSRLPPDIAAFAEEVSRAREGSSPCRSKGTSSPREICTLGSETAPPSFLIWGDSHALTLASEINSLASSRGVAGVLVGRGGCPPLFERGASAALDKSKCRGNVDLVEQAIEKNAIHTVVLIARWAAYMEPRKVAGPLEASVSEDDELRHLLLRTVTRLTQRGITVTVIGPIPELPLHLPTAMIKTRMKGDAFKLELDYGSFLARQERTLSMLERLAQLPNVSVVYPHHLLCSDRLCATVENDFPLYSDDNHLNWRGTAKLAQLLDTFLN